MYYVFILTQLYTIYDQTICEANRNDSKSPKSEVFQFVY